MKPISLEAKRLLSQLKMNQTQTYYKIHHIYIFLLLKKIPVLPDRRAERRLHQGGDPPGGGGQGSLPGLPPPHPGLDRAHPADWQTQPKV